jgi:hypothetical protein
MLEEVFAPGEVRVEPLLSVPAPVPTPLVVVVVPTPEIVEVPMLEEVRRPVVLTDPLEEVVLEPVRLELDEVVPAEPPTELPPSPDPSEPPAPTPWMAFVSRTLEATKFVSSGFPLRSTTLVSVPERWSSILLCRGGAESFQEQPDRQATTAKKEIKLFINLFGKVPYGKLAANGVWYPSTGKSQKSESWIIFRVLTLGRLPVPQRIIQSFFNRTNPHSRAQQFGDVEDAIGPGSFCRQTIKFLIVFPKLECPIGL